MTVNIWLNKGFSQTMDAVQLIRKHVRDSAVMVSHDDETAAALSVADKVIGEPEIEMGRSLSPEDYAFWCSEVVRNNEIDVFIVQRHQRAISASREMFAPLPCKIIVPAGPFTLDTVKDKWRFSHACQNAGLPIPKTRLATDLSSFDQALSEVENDGIACVKPTHGVFASGFFVLSRMSSFLKGLGEIETRTLPTHIYRMALVENPEEIRPTLVMEYLAGPEWSVDLVCDNGIVIAGAVRYKQGFAQRIDANERLLWLARETVRSFELSGLINIQMRATDETEKDIRLLEINPRMSGGIGYASAADVHLPAIAVQHALGREITGARYPASPVMVRPINIAIPVGRLFSTPEFA